MDKKTLVIGVIGADVHAVGNKILYHAFTDAGFNVVNLGVMVSQEEFINAAIETNADAIVISSLLVRVSWIAAVCVKNAMRQVWKTSCSMWAAISLSANSRLTRLKSVLKRWASIAPSRREPRRKLISRH